MNVSKRKGLSAFGLKCNYIKCNHNSKAAGGCGGEEGGVGKTKETINSTVSAGVTEASASQRNATLHKLMASSLHHNGIRMNVSRKMFHYDVQGSVKKKKSKNNYRQKKPKQKKNPNRHRRPPNNNNVPIVSAHSSLVTLLYRFISKYINEKYIHSSHFGTFFFFCTQKITKSTIESACDDPGGWG